MVFVDRSAKATLELMTIQFARVCPLAARCSCCLEEQLYTSVYSQFVDISLQPICTANMWASVYRNQRDDWIEDTAAGDSRQRK